MTAKIGSISEHRLVIQNEFIAIDGKVNNMKERSAALRRLILIEK